MSKFANSIMQGLREAMVATQQPPGRIPASVIVFRDIREPTADEEAAVRLAVPDALSIYPGCWHVARAPEIVEPQMADLLDLWQVSGEAIVHAL